MANHHLLLLIILVITRVSVASRPPSWTTTTPPPSSPPQATFPAPATAPTAGGTDFSSATATGDSKGGRGRYSDGEVPVATVSQWWLAEHPWIFWVMTGVAVVAVTAAVYRYFTNIVNGVKICFSCFSGDGEDDDQVPQPQISILKSFKGNIVTNISSAFHRINSCRGFSVKNITVTPVRERARAGSAVTVTPVRERARRARRARASSAVNSEAHEPTSRRSLVFSEVEEAGIALEIEEAGIALEIKEAGRVSPGIALAKIYYESNFCVK